MAHKIDKRMNKCQKGDHRNCLKAKRLWCGWIRLGKESVQHAWMMLLTRT